MVTCQLRGVPRARASRAGECAAAVWGALDVDDLGAVDGEDLVELLWRRGSGSFCLLGHGEPEHDGVAVDFDASHGGDGGFEPGPARETQLAGDDQLAAARLTASFRADG